MQDNINLNSSYIKNPVWSLSQNDYEQLTADTHLRNAYNIFMLCQIYYLWKEKKIFGKKIAKNSEEVENLLRNKKTFSIDQSQKIVFV